MLGLPVIDRDHQRLVQELDLIAQVATPAPVRAPKRPRFRLGTLDLSGSGHTRLAGVR